MFRMLNYPSSQGVNRFLVWSFENGAQQTSCKRYLPFIEIKNYVMIMGKTFDQPVRNDVITW